MKYYVLKINGKMVRKHRIDQWRDYDGQGSVDMYCTYTDDINLAEKHTQEEFENNTGEVKYIRMYFSDFKNVDGVTTVEFWEFVEVYL